MRTKKNKKFKRKAGSRDSFLSTKVSLRQLSQVGLSQDETDKIFRELASIKIQDRFNEKYLQRCKRLLNVISIRDLEMFNNSFIYFIDSINTTYEFDDKKTPGYLLNIKPMVKDAIRQSNMLLALKRNDDLLKEMFKKAGYNKLGKTIVTSIHNIRNSIVLIQNYKNIALDDYRGAELGVETQPSVRNTTSRRVDSIIRPPRTIRAQAMTRRIRSK